MNATTTAIKAALLRKITMSEVAELPRKSGGFKPVRDFGAKLDADGKILPFEPALIGRILGTVRSYAEEKTDFGDYLCFSGNFGATNAKGKQFRAPKCILPEPAQSLLREAVDAANGGAVELAFDFMAIYDAGDRGYRYSVVPLMQQPEDDAVARLMRETEAKFALPAPKADAQQELPDTGGEAAADPAAAATDDKPTKKAK